MMKKKISRVFEASFRHAQLLTCLFSLFFTFNVMAKQELTFGVVPQQSAAKLAKQWQPLLDSWGRLAGVDIKFATARDIPTFEKRLAAGEYDMAYMNPYHFTLVNHTPGYTALARAKDKRITGILVARKDWDGDLKDLQNQIIAFPAPRAFGATIINQSELSQNGVDFDAKYVGSHDSVYLSVARGLYPAGGGVGRTFNSFNDETKKDLKIIYRTEAYTPHAFAVFNQVDTQTKDALRDAVVKLNQDPQAKQSFDMLKIKGLQMAKDSDWNDIVQLGISL
ncbi:phosphate/phosphite/phosphonate ABC transporter substrate-binding protein [Vibrio sinensis]|uniref:Phosphate/phosphite/phosphonate ABC transporter substrate-binding protein n=2 Tax=Vibrio sinensis TaxID=2302434 RepID=A0A3A6QQM2_9VIBR|nr:phosphate/phosphite/phosphonate ABC transporter substrate-binding protein [Vibrio sinensis]